MMAAPRAIRAVGAIQRRLLVLENEGGAKLFGEPALDLADLMTVDASGAGRIVNISSVAGLGPTGSSIAYAVSKAGLIHLTRCMAVALAPETLVNCVAPGLLEGTRATANLRPEQIERSAATSLLHARIPGLRWPP